MGAGARTRRKNGSLNGWELRVKEQNRLAEEAAKLKTLEAKQAATRSSKWNTDAPKPEDKKPQSTDFKPTRSSMKNTWLDNLANAQAQSDADAIRKTAEAEQAVTRTSAMEKAATHADHAKHREELQSVKAGRAKAAKCASCTQDGGFIKGKCTCHTKVNPFEQLMKDRKAEATRDAANRSTKRASKSNLNLDFLGGGEKPDGNLKHKTKEEIDAKRAEKKAKYLLIWRNKLPEKVQTFSRDPKFRYAKFIDETKYCVVWG